MADRRLLDVGRTADYLNVSRATVRGYVAQGVLTPVRLPSSRNAGSVSRRLLFDVADLDALVEQWKRRSTSAPNRQLSDASVKGWQQSPVRKRGAA